MSTPRRHRPPSRRRPDRIAVLVAGAALAILAACDTGDGKKLEDPAVPFTTTLPPPNTLSSVPLSTSPPITPAATVETVATIAPAAEGFRVFAPWQQGAPIGERHTCDGGEAAPAISWTAPPAGTSELAVVLVDESATDEDGPLVHWVMVGIGADEPSLLEDDVPPGAVLGTNSFGTVGYTAPCPPPGDGPHTYRLTLYALNQQSELADGTPASNLLGFIEDVALGATSLTGTAVR